MTPPINEGSVVPRFRTGVGVDAHAYSMNHDRPMWLLGLFWPDEIGIEALMVTLQLMRSAMRSSLLLALAT
jgi:2C-methyl-D-erythritol 2,4-cyclodiphosphate synthase